MPASRLGLGTVQWGMPYGIGNRSGRPATQDVATILQHATQAGISMLDTAPAYGDAEKLLGQLKSETASYRIVTKIIRPQAAADNWLECSLLESLARLQRPAIDGLLVHHAEDLLGTDGPAVWRQMNVLRDRGLTTRIGVSVYDAAQIDAVLSQCDIDIIQLPFNLLDRRLADSGHLRKLRDRGVEIHARSVFLQGALLMTPDALPPSLQRHGELLQRFHAACHSANLAPLTAALNWVLSHDAISITLCGAESVRQIDEILVAATADFDPACLADFGSSDLSLIDPRQWTY